MNTNSELMNPKNFPDEYDTTEELIRKHKLYAAEWERILNGEIERSKDYWGGYDDSVANDMSELVEMLYDRACLKRDAKAGSYIYNAGIPGEWSASKWLGVASDALDKLNAGDIQAAKDRLQSIRPTDAEPENKLVPSQVICPECRRGNIAPQERDVEIKDVDSVIEISSTYQCYDCEHVWYHVVEMSVGEILSDEIEAPGSRSQPMPPFTEASNDGDFAPPPDDLQDIPF